MICLLENSANYDAFVGKNAEFFEYLTKKKVVISKKEFLFSFEHRVVSFSPHINVLR